MVKAFDISNQDFTGTKLVQKFLTRKGKSVNKIRLYATYRWCHQGHMSHDHSKSQVGVES
jgi:hypothetical protein